MTWQEVIEGANVWVHEYEVNSYKANASAFLLDKNSLAIISPPTGMSEADFAVIEAKGKVTALIDLTLDMISVKLSGKHAILMLNLTLQLLP